MDLVKIFSAKRLSCYQDDAEHRANFILIGEIAPKLGIRNAIASALSIDDDEFISRQTFGYWAKLINETKTHNRLLTLDNIDFRKYSKFNKKANLLNFQKVKISYDLAVKIRNRAFHFENLFKTHENKSPRISTRLGKTIVGIDPNMLECFLDDLLDSFCVGLKDYVK